MEAMGEHNRSSSAAKPGVILKGSPEGTEWTQLFGWVRLQGSCLHKLS